MLSFVCPLLSPAQEWVTYTSRDGLAGDIVMAVAVDSEQNLWFGTQSGLNKFDGTDWITYHADDGLVYDYVSSIAFDGLGNAWIGTSMGVSKFDGKFWQSYTIADGLADNQVKSVLVDKKGNLWFGTWKGVSHFDGKRWETYNSQNVLKANWVWSIAEDQNGDLWFAVYGGGVSRFDGVNWTTYTPDDGLAHLKVISVAIDKKGDKWFGTEGGGVSRFDGKNWTTYTIADGLASNVVTSVVIDQGGTVWFGTSAGSIHSFDGESWQTHSISKTAQGQIIWSMAVDGCGNLWTGTQGGGVKMLPRAAWQVVTSKTGLASVVTTCIAIDNQGDLWVGTYDKGVSHFDGQRWQNYTTADGLVGNDVWAIALDRNGVAWFGTDNGVSRFDGVHWQTYTEADGLAGNNVRAIVEDKAGNIWVGSAVVGESIGGISVFDGVSWYTHRPLVLPHVGNIADAWGLAVADNGDVWATGTFYVGKFDGKEWTIYTTANGLAGYANFKMAIGKDGAVWVATNYGAARYDGQRWRVFTTADGLPEDKVLSIGFDGNGNVWAGVGTSGLARFDGTSWSHVTIPVSGEDTTIAMLRQIVNFITTDADGNVWFATLGGIAHYTLDKVPPKTYITNAPKGTVGLDTVLIEFIGADLVMPTAELLYSYKLDDGDWANFSKSNRVEYTHLAHGAHTFFVRAKDFDGNIDPTPAEWTFNIDVGMPNAVITNPKRGATVTGIVNIIGTAFDTDFEESTVEYGKGKEPSEWFKIGGRSKFPLRDNTLAFWDARGLTGIYSIKLTVSDSFGHLGADSIIVNVVDGLKLIGPKGGHLGTETDRVQIIIPPNALNQDTEISFATISASNIQKPVDPNIIPTGIVYEFQPQNLVLKKPATIIMKYDENEISEVKDEKDLAVFFWNDSLSAWQRLGGTVNVEENRVIFVTSRFTNYAIMEDKSTLALTAPAIELNCQPRVFSPETGMFSTTTTISFGLAKPTSVTIKIYNAARRLERTLIEDKELKPGVAAVKWDGKDDDGNIVTSGLYIVSISAGDMIKSKTVVVLNK
jgi:ligand-binding sensor domain-containing protein